MDGAGSPWFRGDVAIAGDRIEFIGGFQGSAAREIDAGGRVVCPGFIDVHTHSDLQALAQPDHMPKVHQGITTDLIGLDGIGYAPLSRENIEKMHRYWAGISGELGRGWTWSSIDEFLSEFDGTTSANVAAMVPHGCIRAEVIGFDNRAATSEEMEKMRALTAESFEQGAVALSTGLDYYPCGFADTDELVELALVAARFTAPYVAHQRAKRGDGFLDPFRETLEVGRRSGAPVHTSHFGIGATNAGGSAIVLELLDESRAAGVDVTYDAYPYEAGSTSLHIFMPAWAHDGGPDTMLRCVQPGADRERLVHELRNPKAGLALGAGEHLTMSHVAGDDNEWMETKRLSEIAEELGFDAAGAAVEIMHRSKMGNSGVISRGSEPDIREMIRHPAHMFSSDALLIGSHPHPRSRGNYPRVLGRYVRELGVLKLEDAIRHMTSAPATKFGLSDRGILRRGMAADIVIFDPETVKDNATYQEPLLLSEGVETVIVNGVTVIDQGAHTHARPGRGLRRS